MTLMAARMLSMIFRKILCKTCFAHLSKIESSQCIVMRKHTNTPKQKCQVEKIGKKKIYFLICTNLLFEVDRLKACFCCLTVPLLYKGLQVAGMCGT